MAGQNGARNHAKPKKLVGASKKNAPSVEKL
jgi:hypothetical protein